jgi:DNA-binding NarL/FixJ family response regulator
VQNQLAVPVHVGPRAHRSFVIGRSDPYTAAEVDLCRRLQRLLVGLDRQVSAYSRWVMRSGPAAPDVAGSVRLTPRELAVLELLATGLTAGAIARRLAIAERTAQKHLQHAYEKLGVDDRLAAVLRAQHIGLLTTHFPS